METPNELNLVTDPYLFLICGPLGTLAGNQLENNLVTYQKENYLYLFIQVELVSAFDNCPTKDSHHLPAAPHAAAQKRPAPRCEPPRQSPHRPEAQPRAATRSCALGPADILPASCLARSPHEPPDLPTWISIHLHPFLEGLIFYVGICYSYSFVLYLSAEI